MKSNGTFFQLILCSIYSNEEKLDQAEILSSERSLLIIISIMKFPITRNLSKSIIENIEIDNIIYAELTPPGGMGNSGGIIIYIPEKGTDEMICYETSIFKDKETYRLAQELLFRNFDSTKSNEEGNLNFDVYYGGMGNNVFINKNVVLNIH